MKFFLFVGEKERRKKRRFWSSLLPSLGKCRTFCCRSNQGTLSDYGNILGNSSLRAQVASAGGTARGKPHQLLHPELEHNLQRAQCGPFCFPRKEFHWHRDRDGLRIPMWPRLNRYFLRRDDRECQSLVWDWKCCRTQNS